VAFNVDEDVGEEPRDPFVDVGGSGRRQWRVRVVHDRCRFVSR
jgi:hypothetical protein